MKAQWKDYKYGSWLVLVFGQIDAKIVLLDGKSPDKPQRYGIILHPTQIITGWGTLAEAKQVAVDALTKVLNDGLTALMGE
jgi:hypothetical protein